jgi:Circadian oscillating protein COP23
MRSDPVNFYKILSLLSLSICSVFGVMIPTAVKAKSVDFFSCEQDRKEVFTTVIKSRNSGRTREIIRWESKSIPDPKAKCWEVSARFQDLWSKGNLNYLKISTDRNRKAIVYGLATKTSACDGTSKIFEISGTSSKKVYEELMKKLRAEHSSPGIYQGSVRKDEIIIDLKSLIEQQ